MRWEQARVKGQGGDDKKDDEGDGFYLEVKLAWSDGSWSKYYSEAIIADMEYDEVSGRYTVTCPITFDSENMVNYTLTATEAEWITRQTSRRHDTRQIAC